MEEWNVDLEFEQEQQAEYQRGVDLYVVRGPYQPIVEDCPWCVKSCYSFDLLCSWECDTCGYYPGAELYGGRFS